MNDRNHAIAKEPEREEPLLAVGKPHVFKSKGDIRKNLLGVRKIQAVARRFSQRLNSSHSVHPT